MGDKIKLTPGQAKLAEHFEKTLKSEDLDITGAMAGLKIAKALLEAENKEKPVSDETQKRIKSAFDSYVTAETRLAELLEPKFKNIHDEVDRILGYLSEHQLENYTNRNISKDDQNPYLDEKDIRKTFWVSLAIYTDAIKRISTDENENPYKIEGYRARLVTAGTNLLGILKSKPSYNKEAEARLRENIKNLESAVHKARRQGDKKWEADLLRNLGPLQLKLAELLLPDPFNGLRD